MDRIKESLKFLDPPKYHRNSIGIFCFFPSFFLVNNSDPKGGGNLSRRQLEGLDKEVRP